MNKLTLKEKLIYSMGNLGISLITVIHMLFLVYFFFPPKDAGIPYLVPQTSIVIGLTVLGIILSVGRLFDAFIDPVIASISDNSRFKKGKRTPFMRIAAIPFAASYLLPFFVPVTDGISTWNIVWLAVSMVLSATAFTFYAIPFYSLMVEIAKTSEDKVDLGTISSAFWFVGFLIVSFSSSLWGVFQSSFGMEKIIAVRTSFILVAALGTICLLVPALYFDERKFVSRHEKKINVPLIPALKKVVKNGNFRLYLMSNVGYTLATTMFESGLVYFITVLALKEAGVQGPLTTVIGVLTLASYPLINKLSKTKGKKKVMQLGYFLFMLTFLSISVLGLWGINSWFFLGAVVLFAPFSQAAFGILPQVITADCAAWDLHKSGEDHSGMYMAVNGMFAKIGGSLATILFTSFLLLGKDAGNDMGIRVAVIFGAVLSGLGILIMSRYNEKEILSYNKDEAQV
ncbi:MAG: MFS transporter [Spirochaetales bacterium]|nr:MFS transporter [Spirochaetales bacterium]